MAGGGSGGSQGSGRIEYPPYLVNLHNYMLWGTDLRGYRKVSGTEGDGPSDPDPAVWEAIQPYGKRGDQITEAYPPLVSNSLFGQIDQKLSGVTLDDDSPIMKKLDNLHPSLSHFDLPDASDDFFNIVSLAVDAYSDQVDLLADDTALDNAQDALETSTEAAHYRGVNRLTGGFADINATNSSAFFLAMALMESSRQRRIVEQRANWDLHDRYFKVESRLKEAQLELEFQKTRLVAEYDEIDHHVQYLVQSELWDLELFEYGANMLAATSGAVSSKNKSGNKLGSMLAGAAVGTAGAAMYGASTAPAWATGIQAVGGWSTLGIGAAVGGILGMLLSD